MLSAIMTKPATPVPPRRALRTPVGTPPPYQLDWPSRDKLLGIIRHYGPITQAELGRELSLSYNQLSAHLRELEADGLIRTRLADVSRNGGPPTLYEVA